MRGGRLSRRTPNDGASPEAGLPALSHAHVRPGVHDGCCPSCDGGARRAFAAAEFEITEVLARMHSRDTRLRIGCLDLSIGFQAGMRTLEQVDRVIASLPFGDAKAHRDRWQVISSVRGYRIGTMPFDLLG